MSGPFTKVVPGFFIYRRGPSFGARSASLCKAIEDHASVVESLRYSLSITVCARMLGFSFSELQSERMKNYEHVDVYTRAVNRCTLHKGLALPSRDHLVSTCIS